MNRLDVTYNIAMIFIKAKYLKALVLLAKGEACTVNLFLILKEIIALSREIAEDIKCAFTGKPLNPRRLISKL